MNVSKHVIGLWKNNILKRPKSTVQDIITKQLQYNMKYNCRQCPRLHRSTQNKQTQYDVHINRNKTDY